TSLRKLLERDLERIDATPIYAFFGMFFRGSLQSGDDVLDFLVWKWEADRRKIQLTPETVLKLVEQDMMGEDMDERSDEIVDALGKYYRHFKPETLMEALADEYR